ncbi:glycopeptide antibiotics resistance protein [Fontibacillus phaseoli]|uniref:Glycopeptide antibiotics resistance protein n=1 Tax=Fontibacillus phaseoli TaxID=1416533 RepID=A0A369B1S9_9BACL|nr:glycopeptide antibiotics resistance protein [Fontibacillus phaseoli]
MFESYLFPIAYAFMAFPVAALAFTLPFLVVQYRRHGYINKYRAFVLYLFLLYLMNAVFLVMLPFPATRHNAPMSGGTMQLVPFNFIQDILKETSVVKGEPSTYLHLLKERAVLQVLFNVLLTIPFGMLVRYYFRFGPLRCLLLSFLLSLFFEVTQLTGIYGIFDHPYRVFDVDDLMTNTLGGMIGFLAAEWLAGLLPRIEHLDKGVDLSVKRVSYTRRGLAWMFDIVICAILMTVCHKLGIPAAYFVSTGIYFMLLPYLAGGVTFGKWLVRIRLTGAASTSTDHDRNLPVGRQGTGTASSEDGRHPHRGGVNADRPVYDDDPAAEAAALLAGLTNRSKGQGGLAGVNHLHDASDANAANRGESVVGASNLRSEGAATETANRGKSQSGREGRVSLFALILRYGILYWLLFGLNRMLAFSSGELPGISRMFLGVLVLVSDLWFFIHVIKHLFQKDPQLFYEKISKTQHKIIWKPSAGTVGEKA